MAASSVEVVPAKEGMMSVPVRSCTGENFNLDVAKSVSSESLRELIADKFQMNPGAMDLTSSGHSTDSNDGMSAVRSGCTVNVFPKSRTGLDTLPNLSIGQSKSMKPQDIFGLLSSLGSSTDAKVTIVLSGENGQVAETQLDLADAAKLIHAAGRVKERKAKRKRHHLQADRPDSTSSGEQEKRNQKKGKGKAKAETPTPLSPTTPSSPTATKTTIMKPSSAPTTSTSTASSSTPIDSTTTSDDDEDSNEYDSNDDAESTADIIDVLSKFDDIASFLPKELFEKLGAKRRKAGSETASCDVDDDGGNECDTNLDDVITEVGLIKQADPTHGALEVERQRALLEDELRKKAKEMHQRKMENIRTTRKLDLLRCKRDAKKARLARLKREKCQKGTTSATSIPYPSSRKLDNSTTTPHIAKSASTTPSSCSKLTPTNKSSAKKIPVVPGFAGMRRGFLC
eukprot:m.146616 g.146616  ORF g.146616 m.146616 type:complete len:456 (+) comp30487_c0_seq1:393-1760(+)